MMKSIVKTAGAALLVMVAVGAIAASAASATEFIYSTGGKITGRALTTQGFKLGNAGMTCSGATPSGEVSFKFHELPLAISYSGCYLAGIGRGTVSTVDSDWLLPPAVRFENAITIYASVLGEYCKVVIGGGQSLGGNAGEVEYENKSGLVVVKSRVGGIAYEVTESDNTNLCGTVGQKGTNGRFEGSEELELVGGTMEVK